MVLSYVSLLLTFLCALFLLPVLLYLSHMSLPFHCILISNHPCATQTHTPIHDTGLLQIQPSLPGEGLIPPALEPAHVSVLEEAGQIHLLVARAQGLLGRVMVGYRTTPLTACSPEDYEVSFH